MTINFDKVKNAWESLKDDSARRLVKKGEFPHEICYFELNYSEHLELQNIAKSSLR